MEGVQAKRVLEGVLFMSGQPVALKRLKEILSDAELPSLRQVVEELNAEYQQTQRAFRIQEVAGGYQLVTDPDLAPWLKRAFQFPREDSLSKAALETLAIVAYRQPLTKADIEAIAPSPPAKELFFSTPPVSLIFAAQHLPQTRRPRRWSSKKRPPSPFSRQKVFWLALSGVSAIFFLRAAPQFAVQHLLLL